MGSEKLESTGALKKSLEDSAANQVTWQQVSNMSGCKKSILERHRFSK